MDVRPLDDEERKALAKTIADLETLQKEMAKREAPGRGRVDQAAKRVAERTGALLEAKDDEKWKASDDIATWCSLARQPARDPAKLSTNLGELAREDDTEKAYMAQRLIGRALDLGKPNSFLEAFKDSLAFGRIPADLKSWLERAAQQDRDGTAGRKTTQDKTEQPKSLPEVCAALDNKPTTTGTSKPQP